MTRLLLDTSVLMKWFHSDGESGLDQARALLSAHMSGDVVAHMLDLAVYEVGNVLTRALRWRARDVADQLDDLVAICGAPLSLSSAALRDAAVLAGEHGLSYNDAAWAAAARGLGVALVSADRQLLAAGLAESPADVVARLRLSPS